ncbi:MAG: hypothetical protein J7M29_00915, partial [Verrucomicrobia bacterium]|nr:hypothetical protein [Verrucomicrobiota bacterium]
NPKPKPEPKKPEPPDNSQLKLSGITTLLGKRAMFVLIKPGKTNLYSGLVREGERDSVITNLEVLKIDPKGGVVTVRYAGKELALNFKEHGLAPPKPTAVASKKGGTRSPPRPVLTTSARRTAASRTASGARRVYAGRTVYTAPSSAARNSALRPSSPAALRSALSQRRSASSSASHNAARPAVSLQEQIETMKRQAEMARQQGIPMPPLPIAPTGGSQPPSLPGL